LKIDLMSFVIFFLPRWSDDFDKISKTGAE